MTNEYLAEEIEENEAGEVPTDLGLDLTAATLDTFLSVSSVEAAYGTPLKVGDTLVIPAAEVISAMGFGLGSGGADSEEENAPGESSSASGSGGGGGGWAQSRPVAVIIASPDGVQIKPVIDTTKLALAALTTAGFMVGMLVRMTRPR